MSITNIHLKDLKVDNYKSLKKSHISLQNGLNFIIGKNGAGKSNLLEFIYMYATRNFFGMRNMPRALNTNFSVAIEYLENDKVGMLRLLVERIKNNDMFPDANYLYEVTINKSLGNKKIISNEKFVTGDKDPKKFTATRDTYRKELQLLRGFRRTYIEFQFPNNALWVSRPTKFTVDETNDVTFEDSDYSFRLFADLEISLEFEFFNETNKGKRVNGSLLKKRIIKHLSQIIENKNINAILKEYSPIQEIRINPNLNVYSNEQLTIVENLSIDFLLGGNWMPWSFLSDGTKRLFYILTEVISSENGLILLEEPELGIHPHQLFKILQFLKDQSLEKQVIISTHSPLALDILNSEELDRITIARYEKGTKFIKLTKAQIAKARRYMNEVGDFSSFWLHSDLER